MSKLNRVSALCSVIAPAFILIGCASSGSISASKLDAMPGISVVDNLEPVSVEQIAATTALDVFKIGDVAEVTIYNVEDLSGVFVVDRSGTIIFPLIGPVTVAGMNTLELQEALVERYGAELLNDPSITVRLEKAELGKIVVDGAVRKPGVFEVFDLIQLSEAIAMAEGLGDFADQEKVFIVRNVGVTRQVQIVDLKAVRNGVDAEPRIAPGDAIFVQDSQGRKLFNELIRTSPLLSAVIFASTSR